MHAAEGFVHFLWPRTKRGRLSSSGYFLSFPFSCAIFCSAQVQGPLPIAEFGPFLTEATGVVQNKGSCGVEGKLSSN